MKNKIIQLFLVLFLFPSTVLAHKEIIKNYKTKITPQIPQLVRPTVVEIVLPKRQDLEVIVVEETTQQLIGILQKNEKASVKFEVEETSLLNSKSKAQDLFNFNSKNFVEFNLDKDNGHAFVVVKTNPDLKANGLVLSLDEHVNLPNTIQIMAKIDDQWKTIVSQKKLDNRDINFPLNTSHLWKIEFDYSQPLRINEISFVGPELKVDNATIVKWLAKPDTQYTLYSDAVVSTTFSSNEKGQLEGGNIPQTKIEYQSQPNPFFKEPDSDNDTIADIFDNCVFVKNKDQLDLDKNKKGDACEDFDFDGIINLEDNCPLDANANQQDADADKSGDVCDGEESRFTEKNAWISWLGIGFALVICGSMFVYFVKNSKNK